MKKYEYNQFYICLPEDGLNHLAKLNEFGKDGWELLQIQPLDDRNYVYLFKRELQERTLLNESPMDILKDRN